MRWLKQKTNKANIDHTDEDERYNESLERGGSLLWVNESGLYRLIMRSDKPNAKPFQKWVTREVLPSIRKTGSYSIQQQFQIPQTYSEALMLAAKQAEQIEQQNALIELQKPKVEFYEAVTGSSDTIDIGQAAKVLNIKGIGRNNLFEFLFEEPRWGLKPHLFLFSSAVLMYSKNPDGD